MDLHRSVGGAPCNVTNARKREEGMGWIGGERMKKGGRNMLDNETIHQQDVASGKLARLQHDERPKLCCNFWRLLWRERMGQGRGGDEGCMSQIAEHFD